jgi:hypothetical protein
MTRRVAFVLGAWLAIAVIAGAAGLVERLRPPQPQLVLLAAVFALMYSYVRAPQLQAWVDGLRLRTVALLHVPRFVGLYFLILYGRHELPYSFAVPGGIGDIVSASGALIVAALAPDFATRRVLTYAWNTWGLIDILMVVVTAARLFFVDPPSMHALLVLPLSLLPTFYVPIVIATHLLVFRRLTSSRPAPPPRAGIA